MCSLYHRDSVPRWSFDLGFPVDRWLNLVAVAGHFGHPYLAGPGSYAVTLSPARYHSHDNFLSRVHSGRNQGLLAVLAVHCNGPRLEQLQPADCRHVRLLIQLLPVGWSFAISLRCLEVTNWGGSHPVLAITELALTSAFEGTEDSPTFFPTQFGVQ